MNALNGFGLAIGCMDITGALFFEMMIIWMLLRKNGTDETTTPESPGQEQQKPAATSIGNGVSPWMLRIYLFLLNVWIGISILMVTGIILHKPQLLLLWLIWCSGGLLFDMVFVVLWIVELFLGDAIEAFTNILISLLTMAIEFLFIYIIYSIYMNLTLPAKDNQIENNPLLRFAHSLF